MALSGPDIAAHRVWFLVRLIEANAHSGKPFSGTVEMVSMNTHLPHQPGVISEGKTYIFSK